MSCSYAAPGSRKKHSGTSSSSNSPSDMQNRIDRLEGLVLSLMTNGAQSAGPAEASRSLSMSASTGSMEYPPDIGVDGVNNQNGMMRPDGEEGESETDQVAQSLGVLKVFDNKSMYFGEAHWATILQDVRRLSSNVFWLSAHISGRSPRSRTISPSIRNNSKSKHKGSKLPRQKKLSHKGQRSSSVESIHPSFLNYSPRYLNESSLTTSSTDISIPLIPQFVSNDDWVA